MANATDVQSVKDKLPPDADVLGWNDAKIGDVLDAGNTVSQTVRDFWAYRVAQTSEFTNISESGSSRNLEDVWRHALETLKYWDGRVAEEKTSEGTVTPKQSAALHTAVRV